VLRIATALSEWRGRSASVADGSWWHRRRGGAEEAEVLVRWRGQRRCARTCSDSGAWWLRTEARGHGAGRPVGHGVPLWHGATAAPSRAANPGAAHGGLATDRRPHMSEYFKYRKNPKISSLHRKNRYKVRKNLGKFMEVGNPIWNTFQYCNFFQIFTYFELFQRFRVKSSLTELWSIKLVVTAIETPPELNFG
jgi:hypothetical protein